MRMGSFEAWAHDRRFGICMSAPSLSRILRACRAAKDNETGGILIGHYSVRYDCALITEVTGPPKDSRSGKNWFYRGVKGLRGRLAHLWSKQDEYYVGEWHFHPGAPATPSVTDQKQMESIATSEEYHCPEPILVIVGGSAEDSDVIGYVFPRGWQAVQLNRSVSRGCRAESQTAEEAASQPP